MNKTTLLLVILGLAGCGGKDSPTETSSCINVSGAYRAAGSNSCGGSFSNSPVTVAQSGCNFSATMPGGSVTGTINGTSSTFSIVFTPPCAGNATGSATLTSTAIVGTWSGSVTTTAPGCCGVGPISGSFTMTR